MDLIRTLGVAIDPSGAKAGGAVAAAEFRRVGDAAKGAESSIKSFSSSLLSLRNIIAVLGIGALVRELYNTDVAMVRLQNQLKASSGSAEEFRRNFDFLRGASARLGLDLRATGDSFGQFVAAARGKLSGAQIRESFTAITEASTAMGLSAEQTSQTIVALSQMLSKGTVASQELRMQLGNALPGAFQLAAEAMGRTEKEMNKALDTGSIMADELVPRLAKRLHEVFGQQAADGAKGLQAEMNRLKTAWLEVQMVFMSEQGETIFSRAIRGAKEALDDFKSWLAGIFEADREGRLSEAVAASLRVGFGKAANYFGGFVKTAGEMLSEAGKTMFTGDYFKALLGSFVSVAAGFGLALLDAFKKPLAYVQAFFENLFDRIVHAKDYGLAETQARREVGASPQFNGYNFGNGPSSVYFLPNFMRSEEQKGIIAKYEAAVQTRTEQLQREIGDRTIAERADAIMKSGGPTFGFGGSAQTIEQLKSENQKNLDYFTASLAKQSATATAGALSKLSNFAPANVVDTSADESLLKGFSMRSQNPWLKRGAPEAPEVTKLPPKSLWTEMKRGIDDATASLRNLYDQAYKVGTDAVGAMSRGFTGFFDDIIDGTENVIGAFKKMTASILRDIAKIVTQRMIAEPLAGAVMNGIGSLFGGMVGGSGAAGATAGASSAAAASGGFGGQTASVPFMHTGGFVGLTLGPRMLVNPAIFNNAPRFHNGLKPDEFPAILQHGEEVVPKGGSRGGVTLSMPITVNVDGGKGGTPDQNQKMGAEIARQIQGMVDERIARAIQPRGILSPVR